MTHEMPRIGLSAVLLVAAALFATVAVADAADSKPVDSSKVQAAVQESKEGTQSSEKAAESGVENSEVGEASYNVENCEALIEEAENGESSKTGAEQLDLDKCQQLVK